MIQSFTYARLYNLGNYENEKLEVTVLVEDDDVTAARIIAMATVEAEHDRMLEDRRAPTYQQLPKPIAMPAPASGKQRNYIATLQDELGWHSEQMAVYANEQQIDLVSMTTIDASKLIDSMKRLAAENLPF